MAEIILSEKQQKKALRKKKSNKQTVKNVLSTSEELHWPLIKGDDVKIVKEALETYLPRVRTEKIPIHYKDIKDLNKEERKSYRQSLYKNVEVRKEENIIFGINQVSSLVSNKKVKFVLISNDVNPRFILDGVIQNCTTSNIPFLVVPDLKKLLKKKCGFSSMIFAIKDCIEDNTNLCLLNTVLNELYQNYKPSINEDCKEEVIEKDTVPKHDPIVRSNLESLSSETETNPNEEEIKKVNLEDIYLLRKEKSVRAFEPVQNIERKQGVKRQRSDIDYISFESNKNNEEIKKNGVYKPLVVKRVANDPQRNKKKLKKSTLHKK